MTNLTFCQADAKLAAKSRSDITSAVRSFKVRCYSNIWRLETTFAFMFDPRRNQMQFCMTKPILHCANGKLFIHAVMGSNDAIPSAMIVWIRRANKQDMNMPWYEVNHATGEFVLSNKLRYYKNPKRMEEGEKLPEEEHHYLHPINGKHDKWVKINPFALAEDGIPMFEVGDFLEARVRLFFEESNEWGADSDVSDACQVDLGGSMGY